MPRWYMEEMDIAYDLVELSLAQGQNLKEDFLSINPFGKLPVLQQKPNGLQIVSAKWHKQQIRLESSLFFQHLSMCN